MLKISLITICWNSVKRLERCVHSVLAQTLLPTEYIFVDGGSTDGTLELLKSLCDKLERQGVSTRVISQRRVPGEAGIPSAWNQGIACATGEVIALLNSDDTYCAQALEEVVRCFEEHPQWDALAAAIDWVSPEGKFVKKAYPKCLCLSEVMMPIMHPACFFRKRVYDRLGGYDTSYKISADYEFICRCRKRQVVFGYSDSSLTSMETGGTAAQNYNLASDETLAIGLKYASVGLLPRLAWFCRKILIALNLNP